MNFIRRYNSLGLIAFMAFMFLVSCASYAAETSIKVTDVWSKATPNGAKTAVVYMTIENSGATADRLISVDTSLADKAQVHMMMMDGSSMEMRDMGENLSIPAQSKVELSPNGYHVMLMGLKQALTNGSHFNLSLHFAKAGTINVVSEVKPINYSVNQ